MAAAQTSTANLTLEVQRGSLEQARIFEQQPGSPPAAGEVQLRVERFALTANNITYGLIGEQLGYWDFFPAPEREAGWGRLPAMGWARIVGSGVDGLEPGSRYYGWYPMSRYCSFAASATDSGFRDDGAHRSEHAPIYRSYERTDADPEADGVAELEDRHALLRGLFATAVLAEDLFAQNDYFGATTAVVLSASSKTAIGFAQRAAERGVGEVIGLTSAGNREFVEGLGIYSRVLSYGDESQLPAVASVLIDMAGDQAVLARVHGHLENRLKHSMLVGISHQQQPAAPTFDAGPAPEFFFAPAQVEKRTAELGAEGFRELVGTAVARLIGASSEWLRIERAAGPDAALAAYHQVLEGRTPPAVGRIISLH